MVARAGMIFLHQLNLKMQKGEASFAASGTTIKDHQVKEKSGSQPEVRFLIFFIQLIMVKPG